jgi:hypothetical protein
MIQRATANAVNNQKYLAGRYLLRFVVVIGGVEAGL